MKLFIERQRKGFTTKNSEKKILPGGLEAHTYCHLLSGNPALTRGNLQLPLGAK